MTKKDPKIIKTELYLKQFRECQNKPKPEKKFKLIHLPMTRYSQPTAMWVEDLPEEPEQQKLF